MEGLERIVKEHRFFEGLSDDFATLVTGCAKNVRFEAGDYLFREGGETTEYFLIREGRITLEMTAPGRGAVAFQTLGEGDIAGVSWLIPPYRWIYDARALERVRAVSIDATCLRRKCEEDHDLGYEMMKRFVPVLVERLHSTQLQILDVYGAGS